MKSAELPPDEGGRLAALHRHAILDTAPDALFDALTSLASLVCGKPIALVSLVDAERQWFKSEVGLAGVSETPRAVAFCAHAILDHNIFEVPDTLEDSRFHDNPLVADGPSIRSYAGIPIIDDAGFALGTVCVIDRAPGALTPPQRNALCQIGKLTEGLFRERQKSRALAKLEAAARTLNEQAPIGIYHADPDGHCTYTNPRWQEITGLSLAESLDGGWIKAIYPEDRKRVETRWQDAVQAAQEFEEDYRCQRPDGTIRWVHGTARSFKLPDGSPGGFVGIQGDITERKSLEALLQKSLSEKTYLLEEIHHRVKNNLQVIQSMLDMQERRMDNAAAATALRDARNRVHSIALTHQALCQSPDISHIDFACILGDLSAHLKDFHNGGDSAAAGVDIIMEAQSVQMPIGIAIPCGLIVNELVTNAIKHGFHGRHAGRVRIALTKDFAGTVRLTVEDNGVGVVDRDVICAGNSLGLKLVRLLVDDLEGELVVTSDGGTSCSVTFVLPQTNGIAVAA